MNSKSENISNLRRLQLSQLMIAKEIKRICDANGISYFLASGTLLGAVRHRGFIPWDDDLDIGMPRKDYEKFLRVFEKKADTKNFFLQTFDTDLEYGLSFAKVRMNGTFFYESVMSKVNCHKGIFVDVFPFDDAASLRVAKKAHILLYQVFSKMFLYRKNFIPRGTNKIKYVISRVVRYLAFLLPEKMLKSTVQFIMTYFSGNAKRLVNLCGDYGYRECIDADDPFEEIEFENTLFRVPCGREQYLKNVYGDYMQLPPLEKRGNKHGNANSCDTKFCEIELDKNS